MILACFDTFVMIGCWSHARHKSEFVSCRPPCCVTPFCHLHQALGVCRKTVPLALSYEMRISSLDFLI